MLGMHVLHPLDVLPARSSHFAPVDQLRRIIARQTFTASHQRRRNPVVAMMRLEPYVRKVLLLNLFALLVHTAPPQLMNARVQRTTDVQPVVKMQFNAMKVKYAKPLVAL